MRENKLISVIVPIYNTAEYLRRCVDSLLSQTYENIEIVLIDDGSTDSSPEICDQYASEYSKIVVVHKKNGGLSSARNAGVAIAKGEYIGFVDSDDFVEPDFYNQLYLNVGNSDNEISNAMYARYEEGGKKSPSCVEHNIDEDIKPIDFAKELMLHKGDVSVCSKLFPKSLFGKVSFIEGKLNEDLLFILEILKYIKVIHFVGYIGYNYCYRSDSISSSYGKSMIDMVSNSLIARNTVEEKFPELREVAERFSLYQHMVYLLNVPINDANKSNAVYVGALKYLKKHIFSVYKNHYLSFKQKITIYLLMFFPKLTGKIFKYKK